ncbi:Cu,Zn superoxide dismutase-like protein [Basidiobolus meristosporus CBS 931.73]|uniref:Cu,Zn superoxide dismutase-like protein n=1 Tax=Basidiobolus meristosporus CBS 931.73 TaxID=1314790 RepID=A0A1Y1Y4K2_9FUNG|nr:Cu,Zn superoxide dismutase-like protein [Basidiobolus meristosporus CBS 931.73]|eukprot:ORX92835.1 Cu,Zn superoxide dismutase-like protein [Basidiobolus meristosporus CBS 931.73]
MVHFKVFLGAFIGLSLLARCNATVVDRAGADINQNGVVASFAFTPDGRDVKVTVDVKSGLNSSEQYLYHVHEKPVTAENCTSAGGHLDPARVGTAATYKCNAADLSTCEVGDLSGKWGTLNTTTPSFSYVDPTLSLEDHGANNSVVGLSVVIHRMDQTKTRIACANILTLSKSNSQDGEKRAGSSGIQLQVGGWIGVAVLMLGSFDREVSSSSVSGVGASLNSILQEVAFLFSASFTEMISRALILLSALLWTAEVHCNPAGGEHSVGYGSGVLSGADGNSEYSGEGSQSPAYPTNLESDSDSYDSTSHFPRPGRIIHISNDDLNMGSTRKGDAEIRKYLSGVWLDDDNDGGHGYYHDGSHSGASTYRHDDYKVWVPIFRKVNKSYVRHGYGKSNDYY